MYERAGWREAYEQYRKRNRLSKDPNGAYFEVKSFFQIWKRRSNYKNERETETIPYGTPFELKDEQTASRPS